MGKRYSSKGRRILPSAKKPRRTLNDGLLEYIAQRKRVSSTSAMDDETNVILSEGPSINERNGIATTSNNARAAADITPSTSISRKRKRKVGIGLINWRISRRTALSNLDTNVSTDRREEILVDQREELLVQRQEIPRNDLEIAGTSQTNITRTSETYRSTEESSIEKRPTFSESILNDKMNEERRKVILPSDTSESSDSESMDFQIIHSGCDSLPIRGRFIIDGLHFVREMRLLELHRFKCTKSDVGYFKLVHTSCTALIWKLTFECPYCQTRKIVTSEPTSKGISTSSNMSTAEASVWGSMAIGGGHNQLEELMSSIDIKPIDKKTYSKIEQRLGNVWKDVLYKSMKEAGKEEYELAVANGDFTEDGKTPYITVIVDGGWSHRSHGHRYSANSGVACVIGNRTKKLLHLDVRNKYCSKCQYLENLGSSTTHDNCFKNWNKSSSSMEADMIVEAFKMSKEVHGLEYRTFIGDGDSSVFQKVKEFVSYGKHIVKRECANHAVKCFTKNLFKIQKTSPLLRKFLTNPFILKLKKATRAAISSCASRSENTDKLVADIKNAPFHIWGDHRHCDSNFCTKKEESSILSNDKLTVLNCINECMKSLIRKAPQLVTNDTSNLAENLMSLVAKFTGGKQVNRGKKGSFSFRTWGAGLDFQFGPSWHCNAIRSYKGNTPLTMHRVASQRKRRLALTKSSKILNGKKYSQKSMNVTREENGNADYGPTCQQPDMTAEQFQQESDEFLKKLSLTSDEIKNLEIQTRGQSANELWFAARKHRITASNFGEICKRRSTSKWGPVVKKLLYKDGFSNEATIYGNINEKNAIKQYEDITKRVVEPCGLFVHKDFGWLGASPDGITSDKLIEVKCPKSMEHLTINEAIQSKKNCFLDENCDLKKNHNYFYQVQGQLQVCNASSCDFIVWTKKDILIKNIARDDDFWEKKMREKLIYFYNKILLNEIIDPRVWRNMPIKESSEYKESRQQ